jgi:hypothetical protein
MGTESRLAPLLHGFQTTPLCGHLIEPWDFYLEEQGVATTQHPQRLFSRSDWTFSQGAASIAVRMDPTARCSVKVSPMELTPEHARIFANLVAFGVLRPREGALAVREIVLGEIALKLNSEHARWGSGFYNTVIGGRYFRAGVGERGLRAMQGPDDWAEIADHELAFHTAERALAIALPPLPASTPDEHPREALSATRA